MVAEAGVESSSRNSHGPAPKLDAVSHVEAQRDADGEDKVHPVHPWWFWAWNVANQKRILVND